MTHEIKQLIGTAAAWQQEGKRSVLATVVKLEGSAYRRPGVRMLISDAGDAAGAVSGGCVENEIQRQAESVFQSGKPKIMTYDGRLRLGCDGLLYLLLEPFVVSEVLLDAFTNALEKRLSFKSETYFYPSTGTHEDTGSLMVIEGHSYPMRPDFIQDQPGDRECFSITHPPLFQLFIFGAEHDAVHLSTAAQQLGWEVTIVAPPGEAKTGEYFPGAACLISPTFEQIDTSGIDEQTAVVLMSHSFNKDVQYLIALKDIRPAYFGLLGPGHRREQLLSKFLEYCPDASPEFLDQLYGPAGISIGAESPPEVAVSILAEILSVLRDQKPVSLREKSGEIHG